MSGPIRTKPSANWIEWQSGRIVRQRTYTAPLAPSITAPREAAH